MSLSLGNPLETQEFKQQVRRHCEQKLAENLLSSSPASHGHRLHPGPGPRLELHEQRRSSDGQLPRMSPSKGGPGPVGSPHHPVPKSGGLKLPTSDVRRFSDGQLRRMLPGHDSQMFVGPPPKMIPKHIEPRHAEIRRSSDGQLGDPFQGPSPFGPPPQVIPKRITDLEHIQQQSGNDEVLVSAKTFRVDVDVAAYAPEELAVKIVGDHVVIKGKHAEGSPGEKAKITREFSRRYALPEDVVVENATVFLAKTGRLSVKVPRRSTEDEETHAAEKCTTERKTKVKFKE